ncbi:polyprenyl synthetase family protein [Ignavigranum ruoffiae]|uniref:Heptaprenyl diphosphate synthase n=1 Tax=Ignavigranum ruoffiae TaxID=89093 RepID=A0A1H9E1L3_9LACT|nr:polyprenyl synthetase family protein [Ignavigranum ruoffiae]SEQ18828.1 heptaprenyl diphosphate synthase [Ignavigranum ruoffiae]
MTNSIWQAYPVIDQHLNLVKEMMLTEINISQKDIQQKIEEYIHAPGKYLRAGLCLLFSLIKEGKISEDKLYLAAAIETFHLATLIHDDVIDHSPLRRNIEAIQQSHSNRIAIYAGDYLLVTAAHLVAKTSFDRQSEVSFNWAGESILEGELLQLTNQYNPQMTFPHYLKQIRGKTALLFALSTYAGYYQSRATKRINKRAFYVGEDIGMFFQLTDDLIDYRSDSQLSGKPRLQDIRNGIYSAPILYSLQKYPRLLEQISQKDSLSDQDCEMIYQQVIAAGGIEATIKLVERYQDRIQQKLAKLPGQTVYIQQVEEIIAGLSQRQK